MINTIPTQDQIDLMGLMLSISTQLEEWVAEDPANRFACAASPDSILGEYGCASIEDYDREQELIDEKEARKNWYYEAELEWEKAQAEEERLHAEALASTVSYEFKPLGVPLPL